MAVFRSGVKNRCPCTRYFCVLILLFCPSAKRCGALQVLLLVALLVLDVMDDLFSKGLKLNSKSIIYNC